MDTAFESSTFLKSCEVESSPVPFATLAPEPVAFELTPLGDAKHVVRQFERKTSPIITVRRCVEHYVPEYNEYASSCPVVSRSHAQLKFTVAAVVVIDCGSHHGTWVTSLGGPTTKLAPTTPHVLQDGDIIQFGKAVTKAGQQHEPLQVQVKLLTAADLPSSAYKASGRYGLISDDEPEVVEHWPISPSPAHYEEIDSDMDEDEDTTSVDIKVYEAPPTQKEEDTVHDDMKKLQNDFSRVDKEVSKLKASYLFKRRNKATQAGTFTSKVNVLSTRIDSISADLKNLLEREADVAALRGQVETLLSTTRADMESLRGSLGAIAEELHVIRRDQLMEAQGLAGVDEKPGKRKRDDEDDSVDEDLPLTKRTRVATVTNSLACAAVGGLVVWAGLAFT